MPAKRVLVSGGRDFALPDEVHRILGKINASFGITELAHGGATGADELCKLWALTYGVPVLEYEASKAEWEVWGNRAGNMRNSRMLRSFKPDLGVVFPGGRGTADMKGKLIEARVNTLIGTYTNVERTTVQWSIRSPLHLF